MPHAAKQPRQQHIPRRCQRRVLTTASLRQRQLRLGRAGEQRRDTARRHDDWHCQKVCRGHALVAACCPTRTRRERGLKTLLRQLTVEVGRRPAWAGDADEKLGAAHGVLAWRHHQPHTRYARVELGDKHCPMAWYDVLVALNAASCFHDSLLSIVKTRDTEMAVLRLRRFPWVNGIPSQLRDIPQRLHLPPPRYRPQLRVHERVREEGGGGGVHSGGLAAFGFGADGVEVHEPALEERPRHLLQRLAHPPVQLDLVVQRAEDVGNALLLGEGWEVKRERFDSSR